MEISEQQSRVIPWLPGETAWAHDRPRRHRVPMPDVGDTVLYRHHDWGDPEPAEVIWVQPVDDVDDPHVATVTVDGDGAPMLLEGRPVMALKVDPWRRVHLRTRFGTVDTREARLRGSAGWLPLDWRARYRPVPQPSAATAVRVPMAASIPAGPITRPVDLGPFGRAPTTAPEE